MQAMHAHSSRLCTNLPKKSNNDSKGQERTNDNNNVADEREETEAESGPALVVPKCRTRHRFCLVRDSTFSTCACLSISCSVGNLNLTAVVKRRGFSNPEYFEDAHPAPRRPFSRSIRGGVSQRSTANFSLGNPYGTQRRYVGECGRSEMRVDFVSPKRVWYTGMYYRTVKNVILRHTIPAKSDCLFPPLPPHGGVQHSGVRGDGRAQQGPVRPSHHHPPAVK